MTESTINDELSQLSALAVKTVKICAKNIKNNIKPTFLHNKTHLTNPLSTADEIGEKIIKNLLLSERPDDGILGEEGTFLPSNNGFRWIFDALDGTVNYLYNIPHWAVSLSCEKLTGDNNWQTIIGVVYDPVRKELFTTIKGRGAQLNGKSLLVNKITEVEKALVATEFSYSPSVRLIQLRTFSRLLPKVKDIRSTGSSALDLCWVALGRFDAFYESDLYEWDWSASKLIVEESGGVTSFYGTGIVASNPIIHQNLLKVLV